MPVRQTVLLLLIFTASCSVSRQSLPQEIFNHWKHSHEEDTAGEQVFRPATYAFPPSRGREGFEIKPDGQFIRHAIGAADAPEKMNGRWIMKSKDVIEVTLDDKSVSPYLLVIQSVSKEKLTLKP